VALQSDFGYAHLTRGQALKQLGRTDESLRAFRQALLCRPEFADMHLALGEALAESGKVSEGLEHLQNAARHAPPDDARPREALKKWQAKKKPAP
jgi:tetratricopeptide (TPR) repeat protein